MPKTSSIKLFNKKPQTQETEKHPYSAITTAKSADRPCSTGHSLPLYPTIGNPIFPHQRHTQIQQTQAQQQQQITPQILLPYSGFLPNTTLPPPTLIQAPPRAPQLELLKHSTVVHSTN